MASRARWRIHAQPAMSGKTFSLSLQWLSEILHAWGGRIMKGSAQRTFWLTPQHMPEELLATMPPIMQESMEDGSGPILYWMSCPPFALCRASSALISPPISPGSTVMLLPSPC